MLTTPWTLDEKLQALMALAWSIRVSEDPEAASLVARVDEVPDAIATGLTERDLARDLWESLAASLLVRLEHDDPIPLPKGARLPWLARKRPTASLIRNQFVEGVQRPL